MSEKYSFKVLRKKIEKVDAVLKDLDPSDEKHRKMEKKRAQYMNQLKELPEWKTEGPLIEKKERLLREAKRLRQAANQAEEKRHKHEEEKSGAREEARRMMREKREKEEARRKAEKAAKLQAEEDARIAKEIRLREREERERRAKEEEERRAREEQARLKREKEERERHERERLAREEQERHLREEEEKRRAREELEREERERHERLAREEQERREREEEEERRAREEQERLKREREERERHESERLAREEQERREREEEEGRRAREEQERLEREKEQRHERERLAREEQERLEREEEERRAKAELERREREEADLRSKEEQDRFELEQAKEAAEEGQQKIEREVEERCAKDEKEVLERIEAEKTEKEVEQEEMESAAKEDETFEPEQAQQSDEELLVNAQNGEPLKSEGDLESSVREGEDNAILEQDTGDHPAEEGLVSEEAGQLITEGVDKHENEAEESIVGGETVYELGMKQMMNPSRLSAEKAEIDHNDQGLRGGEGETTDEAIAEGNSIVGDREEATECEGVGSEGVKCEGMESNVQDTTVDGHDEGTPIDLTRTDQESQGLLQFTERDDNGKGSDIIKVEGGQHQESVEAPPVPPTESSMRPQQPPGGGMGGLVKNDEVDSTRTPETNVLVVEPNHAESEESTNAPVTTPEVTRGTGEEDFLSARQSMLSMPRSENTQKILQEISAAEEYQKKLEKHLNQNGIPVPVDIPYEVCRDKIASIREKMRILQSSEHDPYTMEKKYFELEQEMMKYSSAMMLTDEWAAEQRRLEEEWEDAIKSDNLTAIKQVRNHMPVNVRSMTEEALTTQASPNGKVLPKQFAKKFKRTNVLQLLRVNPDDIEKMHPSYFEGMRTTGLTLTERRALHEHMREIGARWQAMKVDKNVERKWIWHATLKAKFKEVQMAYDKHVEEYGPADAHPYAKRSDPEAGGCPLIGNQCPVKADRVLDYSEDYGYTMEAEYESSGSQKSSEPKSLVSNQKLATVGMSKKKDDEEIMALLRDRLKLDSAESETDKKFLRELFYAEKRTRLLEKSLAQAGIEVPKDDISYAEARSKVEELGAQIKEIGMKMASVSVPKEMAALEKEYVGLSSELDKYNNAMMLTKEWAAEQMEKERLWEERVRVKNEDALRMIRRHMPINIRDMSEGALITETTPNGKKLPQKIARKFKRTNILLLLRMDPSAIEPMHPSSLESMRTTGLTLTERRALHEHLKTLGTRWKGLANDKMAERKWMWHESLRSKFRELVDKYDEHVEKYGPPDNHPYAKHSDPTVVGCPLLGNQCPVKADLAVDYSGDYGFPEDAEYRTDAVAKSNLVTMEDINKRREEDEAEEGSKKAGGFFSAIMGRKK
eukprot:scaffold1118_cov135-Cylindrotheca_fusiformis.AAC.13